MAIRSLRLREKEHRRAGKEDVTKHKTWHNPALLKAYRAYAVAKLLRIREEIAYHDSKSIIINQTLKVCIIYEIYLLMGRIENQTRNNNACCFGS